MNDIITGDDILGKEVIDNFGRKIGVIMKIHISRSKRAVMGISIDRGFISSDIFIGSDYIKTFGHDVVILSKAPVFSYEGSKLYREDGKYFGKIESVKLNKQSNLDKIYFINEFATIKNKIKCVSRPMIKTIGINIILKKEFTVRN
jgi:sporulation protein YlmC with PRC-barrel domain